MVALFCVINVSKAQMKPEAGDMSLGFKVTGLAGVSFLNWSQTGLGGQVINDPLGILPPGTTVSTLIPQNTLFGRYYLSSDLALRVSLGINSVSESSTSVDSVFIPERGIETIDSKMSGFSWSLGAGIEKHFATSASRLDPYAGAHFNIAMLGNLKMETNTDDSFVTAANNFSVTDNVVWSGGSAWNFDLIGGFNYFFSDNIAIGAEVSWGYMGMGIGGEYTEDVSVTVGGTTTTTKTIGESKTSASGFRVGSTSGVNFSIFW